MSGQRVRSRLIRKSRMVRAICCSHYSVRTGCRREALSAFLPCRWASPWKSTASFSSNDKALCRHGGWPDTVPGVPGMYVLKRLLKRRARVLAQFVEDDLRPRLLRHINFGNVRGEIRRRIRRIKCNACRIRIGKAAQFGGVVAGNPT